MPAGQLRINEIFFSIQGESTWSGCPCVFIRLTGCHLRCRYCDTAYAFKEGENRPIDSIIDEVCSHPTNLIEITGGEPLLQKNVGELIGRLCELGKTVLIETSGACDIGPFRPADNVQGEVIFIMDLKTPGSGECDRNIWSNIDHLTQRDEVKFVITDREDYDWAVEVTRKHHLSRRVKAVLMSPVFEQPPGSEIEGCDGLSPRDLAEWLLVDAIPNVRMQSQLHKLIWDPQMRGV